MFAIDQATCDGTTSSNNTYFVNPGYPGSWSGGPSYVLYFVIKFVNIEMFVMFNNVLCRCGVSVNPCSDTVCQLRIDFLDLSLAPPNGDGVCATDIFSVSGGATNVPNLCGSLSGQHVVVDFLGTSSISVAVVATASYTFGRHWNIKITQINCDSRNRGKYTFHQSIQRQYVCL